MPERPRILLAVDDEDLAHAMSAWFETEGYATSVALGLDFTLRAVSEAACDLVVVDLLGRNESGRAIVARIRDEAPRIPVVVLGARAAHLEGNAIRDLGAAIYLQQPVSGVGLLAVAKRLLERA